MCIVFIGTDLIEIMRVEKLTERKPQFLERVFTSGEKDYCLARGRPGASFAARWAAKEAVAKALGMGLGTCGPRCIEVVQEIGGRPAIRLCGRAAARAEALGIVTIRVSLTHTRAHAMAFVVAEGR